MNFLPLIDTWTTRRIILLSIIMLVASAAAATDAYAQADGPVIDGPAITKSAMKARSTVVTGNTCEHHRDLLNRDGSASWSCHSIYVGKCKVNKLNKYWGSCQAEYEVHSATYPVIWQCLATLKWMVVGYPDHWEIKARTKHRFYCDDITMG